MESGAGHVVVVGAGGNIGSHLVPHLARLAAVRRLTLVDPDVYEPANLAGQDAAPRDLGRNKARVQAARARRLRPGLVVEAWPRRVEELPLGCLRADLLIACVDGRAARQAVNQAALRLGRPWIDAGVDGTGLLARVDVYPAGPERACLECAWDERDYALLEQRYPCRAAAAPAPTRAPSALGAAAAALQAIEAAKLLAAGSAAAPRDGQVLIDLAHHRHFATAHRRHPACRCRHAAWPIQALPASVAGAPLRALLDAAAGALGEAPLSLGVAGARWARLRRCRRCGRSRRWLRVLRAGAEASAPCPCGARLTVFGFDRCDRLPLAELVDRDRGRSLRALGLLDGDVVVCAARAGEVFLEVAGERR